MGKKTLMLGRKKVSIKMPRASELKQAAFRISMNDFERKSTVKTLAPEFFFQDNRSKEDFEKYRNKVKGKLPVNSPRQLRCRV